MRRSMFAAPAMAAVLAAAGPTAAQDLVFTPVNPSFGGDPFNSSHLLEIANAQRPEKKRDLYDDELTMSELFLQQLESRLLSAVAADVTDAIFGEGAVDSGSVTFADQFVQFERGLDSVTLIVTDLSTGGSTTIEIPILVAD